MSVTTAQKWIKKNKDGEKVIYGELRSRRAVNFNNDVLKSLVEKEPKLTVDWIAKRVDSFHGTVFRYLKDVVKVSKFGKWVPHELTEANFHQ